MPTTAHIWNQYTLRVLGQGGRDALKAAFTAKKIGTEVYYPVPMHQQECFADLASVEVAAAQRGATRRRRRLSIPIYPELTRAQQDEVIAAIAAFLKGCGAMKIVTVVGARPQFIKAAPVGRALREAGHREVLVHTGQHYDDAMADVFFRELEIPRARRQSGRGLRDRTRYQTGQMLMRLEEVLLEREAGLGADLRRHELDAGRGARGEQAAHPRGPCRSGHAQLQPRCMPEEINRVLSDHVSDLALLSHDDERRESASRGHHARACTRSVTSCTTRS